MDIDWKENKEKRDEEDWGEGSEKKLWKRKR